MLYFCITSKSNKRSWWVTFRKINAGWGREIRVKLTCPSVRTSLRGLINSGRFRELLNYRSTVLNYARARIRTARKIYVSKLFMRRAEITCKGNVDTRSASQRLTIDIEPRNEAIAKCHGVKLHVRSGYTFAQ